MYLIDKIISTLTIRLLEISWLYHYMLDFRHPVFKKKKHYVSYHVLNPWNPFLLINTDINYISSLYVYFECCVYKYFNNICFLVILKNKLWKRCFSLDIWRKNNNQQNSFTNSFFVVIWQDTGIKLTQEEVQILLSELDSDGDGEINFRWATSHNRE